MATLRELKGRIGSVASSQKITGAMKMIFFRKDAQGRAEPQASATFPRADRAGDWKHTWIRHPLHITADGRARSEKNNHFGVRVRRRSVRRL